MKRIFTKIESILGHNRKNIVVACLGLLMPLFLTASKTSLFDKMSYQEVVEVTIEGDFTTLTTNRRSGEAQKMVLTFKDETGQLQTWNTKTTLRGHFRRMRCDAMPPLKLNFKKSELKEAGLAKFDDMKLVTQCMDNTNSKDWVLKEFLAYKLFNELSEESFRVQLLKVTYKDTKTEKSTKQWGFLIEDTAELRNRIGAEKSKLKRSIPLDSLNQASFHKMAIFQYMIGNNDWDFTVGRNIKVVKKGDKYILIPYDFDFSGLVHASYAIPNPNFGLTSTRERNYMGFEEDLAHLDSTLAFYESKKSVINKTIRNFKKLRNAERVEVQKYINTFFENIETIDYHPKKTLLISKVVGNHID